MVRKSLPVSIIIPTFNEGKYLPNLLRSMKRQTVLPSEIIVIDAYSSDKTQAIAKEFGCKVIISSAWISGARNIGAKAAKSPLLLFLDADVVLPQSFLEKTITEMLDRKLAIASCYLQPLSKLTVDRLLHEATNYYLKLTKHFYPHVPGFCIFVKKTVHMKIKGFDESLVLAEDHDYVQRAGKVAPFGYLQCYKIPVSVRRLAEEGRLKLVLKYIAVELHLMLIGKIRKNIFSYRFGKHYMLDKIYKIDEFLF